MDFHKTRDILRCLPYSRIDVSHYVIRRSHVARLCCIETVAFDFGRTIGTTCDHFPIQAASLQLDFSGEELFRDHDAEIMAITLFILSFLLLDLKSSKIQIQAAAHNLIFQLNKAADWPVDASIDNDDVVVGYGVANACGTCRHFAKLTPSMEKLGGASWCPERVHAYSAIDQLFPKR